MPALPELQRGFRQALLHGATAEAALLARLVGDEARTRAGIAAYRRSVMGNLTAALQGCYPVVAELVGLPFFREAARQYLLAHPSRSGDLNALGEDFGDFLAAYPPAVELPYLPDVARLEWLVQCVYCAADAAPPELSALAGCGPEDYPALVFDPVADHTRFDSRWPVGRIRAWHQPGAERSARIDFETGCRLLIHRQHGEIIVDELTTAEAAFFDHLAAGHTLGLATEAALGIEPSFDLGATLGRLLAAGLFQSAHLSHPGSPS